MMFHALKSNCFLQYAATLTCGCIIEKQLERSVKWHVRVATPRTVVCLTEKQSSIILSCITKPVKLESGSAWLSGRKNRPMAFVYTS